MAGAEAVAGRGEVLTVCFQGEVFHSRYGSGSHCLRCSRTSILQMQLTVNVQIMQEQNTPSSTHHTDIQN